MLKWIIIIIIILALATGIFAYRNLTYDYGNDLFMEKKGEKLGFSEKQYTTYDGYDISYLEGPNNGEPLLLIHGQMASKEDYAKVLPELSKHFHIFAVDCYGQGKSSKTPEKYNINSLSDDIILFMKDVIKEKVIITGHSSGALISANIAAKDKDGIKGLILEDGPFFSTEKSRAKNTFAYLEFELIDSYLNQEKESNYTKYYLEHTYIQNFFNKKEKDNWSNIVKKPFLKRLEKNKEKMPLVWYYPPEIGLNNLVFMTRNMQDKTGNYDLRFGQKFYDFSWFNGLDQKQMLSEIECPTFIMHVAPPKETTPGYYDDKGILLSAMDEKDALMVNDLIKGSVLKEGYDSSHNIHADLSKEFIETVLEFKAYIEK